MEAVSEGAATIAEVAEAAGLTAVVEPALVEAAVVETVVIESAVANKAVELIAAAGRGEVATETFKAAEAAAAEEEETGSEEKVAPLHT